MKKLSLLSFILLLLINLSAKAQNSSGWDWASISGTVSSSPGNKVIDIVTDASGNVYTVGTYNVAITIGSTTLPAPTGRDIFIAKYNASGSMIWLKKHTPPTGYSEIGQVINVDANGNVYIGGTDDNSFLAKYDSAGNLLWNKVFTLYEVGGINFAADGNPIIMESNAGAKNIKKINKTDGSEIWSASVTGAGSNAGTTFQDFTDAAGNIYFTCFNISASNVNILGDSFPTTGPASFVVSLNSDGTKRWIQKFDNVQLQLGYTVDANGKSYIQLGGGFGATFQGFSTASPLGDRYFELNNSGTVTRHLLASPYKGLFRVKSDGIYGYEKAQAAGISYTETFGDYYFRVNGSPNTKALAIVIKYSPADNDKVVWANSFEINGTGNNSGDLNTIEVEANQKVLVGGMYGTSIKTGTTSYTASNSGYFYTDLFVAQFDGSNVAAPAVTNWTGNSGNSLWTDAGNWDNGAPNGSEKVVIPSGKATYPTGITIANATGRLEIGTGVNLSLPMDFVAPGGIFNQGNITVTGTGTFVGFNSKASPLTGTGKVIFDTTSPSGLANFDFSGSLEVNRTGVVATLNISVAKNLIITSGKLSVNELKMTDPNATITSSATGYVYAGTLKRAVNSSGVYSFPVGSTNNYAPVSITLNNIVGPSTLSVHYDYPYSNTNGSTPNISLPASNSITTLLNNNIWTVSADAAITSGTYDINLRATNYTNGVTDVTRFVPIRRAYTASAWTFEGTNGTSTQTGETINTGVTSNGIINAYDSGLKNFGDFGVGIAATSFAAGTSTSTTNWTGTAGDKTWATASNWNNGVPNGLKDAIIPTGASTYPEIFVASDNAKSLTINSGVTVKMPFTLKVSGTLTNNGSINIVGNTGNYFRGFRAAYSDAPALLKGSGKLLFTDASPKGTQLDTVLLVNDMEINRTVAFKISNKTSGNINFLNGIIGGTNLDGVEPSINMTNPLATITNNAPTSYTDAYLLRAVATTGTYNFPIGSTNYMPTIITTSSLLGTSAYSVQLGAAFPAPKLIVDGYPVVSFLDLNKTWDISPSGVATGGTISLNFEARGYTNGVSDVNRYVLLKRQDINFAWESVSSAVFTENSGVISVSVPNQSPIITSAQFTIAIKGSAVTWNGNTSNNYNTATNWTPATVPDANYKVIFNSGATNYPSTYPASALMEVGAGTSLSLPSTTTAGAGIVNNGTIIITSTGAFNGFNNGSTQLSGTGKLVFNASGPSSLNVDKIGNGIEVNRPSGIFLSQNLEVTGDVKLTDGIVSGAYSFTMSNPNATLTAGSTAYFTTLTFVRAVNVSGNYVFPIGTSTKYEPATLDLSALVGPTKITSSFVTSGTGAISPAVVGGGKSYAKTLNVGVWTIKSDAYITGGSYKVTLQANGYTNGSTDATVYGVLKRDASYYAWNTYGTRITSTETGGIITASSSGITSFSEFAIGVASPYETKWTGTAADFNWATANNWDNGVPSSTQKAVFDGSSANLPTNNFPYNNTIDKLEVASGLTVNIPSQTTYTSGIINNGTVIPNGSSITNWTVSGTGTVSYTSAFSGSNVTLPATATTYSNNIEVNRSSGLTLNGHFFGNLSLKNGLISTSSGLFMDDPSATVTQTSTSSYISGALTRKVNTNGTYFFPVGSTTSSNPMTLALTNIAGLTAIKVQFYALAPNPAPAFTINSINVPAGLNGGFWFVFPDVALTSGTYSATFGMNKYTNGVTNADRYVAIKQPAYTQAWVYEGSNGASTQTGGTNNSSVISNGTMQVTANGQTTMPTSMVYAIGIADAPINPGTLPVKLVNFIAKADGKASQLTWQTQTEINNNRFEVERSLDGLSWIKIGEIKGAGSNYQLKNYAFRDVFPANGVNYYRLKQIDNNDAFEYSAIKTIKFTLTDDVKISIYPNPITDYIRFSGTGSKNLTVSLIDLSGKVIFKVVNISESLSIPANINNGIYLLKINSEYQESTLRVLLKR